MDSKRNWDGFRFIEDGKIMKAERVISLGMNCEVSFQIERYVEKLDASLFSWAFILDDDLFVEALNHLDSIFEGEISFNQASNDMFFCDTYRIAFHGRTPKQLMLHKNGRIKHRRVYKAAVKELHSRINYLKEKFKKQLQAEEYTVFLKKMEVNGDYVKAERVIKGLADFFKRENHNGNYKLVIVIEEKYENAILRALETENVAIRTVAFFSPVEDTKDGADNMGWSRIFKEFICGEDREENDSLHSKTEEDESLKEIYDRMKYYEEHCKQLEFENQKLLDLLNKQRQWMKELQSGKDWLEEQYKNLIKLPEKERQKWGQA